MATAAPDRIRPVMSISGVGAIAAINDPRNIKNIATSCMRFLPSRSARLPVGSKSAPIVNVPARGIQAALDRGRLKSLAIVGKATFVKNISNEAIKFANASAQNTYQR